MEKEYVEKRDEGYWIAGTRVSLDSVVFAFLDGLSPETIMSEISRTAQERGLTADILESILDEGHLDSTR